MNNPTKRILIVDDEEYNRDLLGQMLSSRGHEVEFAEDGFQALSMINLGFDLVLLDITMPGMDGFEVAGRIREEFDSQELPICMVTGLTAREERLRAIEAGVNDFINKPVDMLEINIRVASLLRLKESNDAIKRHQSELEVMVDQRTRDLKKALQKTANAERKAYHAQLETIERLVLAAEYKDQDAALHIKRMSHYSHLLATKLHLRPQKCETILNASPMHDVGKIGVPDAILLKPGKLEPDEWEIMKRHTVIGAKILGGSGSELLQAGAVIAISHHERWAGGGYPNGLTGDSIPLLGRIVAIADVFDALTSRRPYEGPFSSDKALEIMKEGRGTHFDPTILDLFLNNFGEIENIRSRFNPD
jgi:putative two-component system response regulator